MTGPRDVREKRRRAKRRRDRGRFMGPRWRRLTLVWSNSMTEAMSQHMDAMFWTQPGLSFTPHSLSFPTETVVENLGERQELER